MPARPRIDLDGVPLVDPAVPTMPLAIFRYRTTGGLVLLIPESADVSVPWEHVSSAEMDLVGGSVRVVFEPEYAAGQGWLRGATAIEGRWLDRHTM